MARAICESLVWFSALVNDFTGLPTVGFWYPDVRQSVVDLISVMGSTYNNALETYSGLSASAIAVLNHGPGAIEDLTTGLTANYSPDYGGSHLVDTIGYSYFPSTNFADTYLTIQNAAIPDQDYNTGILSHTPGIGSFLVREASVPEPATLALLGMGFAGLGVIRRRKTTA